MLDTGGFGACSSPASFLLIALARDQEHSVQCCCAAAIDSDLPQAKRGGGWYPPLPGDSGVVHAPGQFGPKRIDP